MYDIKLINPLRQFGYVYWTLICEDVTGNLESLRIDKKYKETDTSEDICADIQVTVAGYLSEDDAAQLPGTPVTVFDVGGIQHIWQI